MVKFFIYLAVRLIAACRYIKIMNGNRCAICFNHGLHVAAILFAAKIDIITVDNRQF